MSSHCESRLSCNTSCSYPALPPPNCHTDINTHCQEEEEEEEGEVRKCEMVNMVECEDSVLCEDVMTDCEEAETEAELEVVGENCSETVREECVPVTEEVCTTRQLTECLENTEEDCEKDCEEVLEEVEVPCQREQQVCQEMMKPVCAVNRINCTAEQMEEMEEMEGKEGMEGNTEIIFSINELGRKKMTFSRLINETRLEEDFEVDAPTEPTMVITRDIINNILDIEMDGLAGRASGCIVVR